MRVSDRGIAFIESNESFSAIIYQDVGRPCIGFGHDIQPGEQFNPPITRAQARQLLAQDLSTRFEPILNRLVPADCTQDQFDALADFCYNDGPSALAELLDHGWNQVTNQLPRWIYARRNGVLTKDPDLILRRRREIKMFEGDDNA